MRITFKFSETPEEQEDGSVAGLVTLSFGDSVNEAETVYFNDIPMALRENGEVSFGFDEQALKHFTLSDGLLERIKKEFKEHVESILYY
jgi:hypothetical protein